MSQKVHKTATRKTNVMGLISTNRKKNETNYIENSSFKIIQTRIIFPMSVKLAGLEDTWRIVKALFCNIYTRVFSMEVGGWAIQLTGIGSSSMWGRIII